MKKHIILGLCTCLFISSMLAPSVSAAPPHSLTMIATSQSLHQLVHKAQLAWPWYVTRASGLVATGLLILLVLSGIGLVTGYTYRLVEPLAAWRLHRSLGIAFGGTLLVHILSLLFDTYVPFTVLQVFVPFLSHYTPVVIDGVRLGSLYVALGIFALYAAAAVLLSSLVWIDKKPRTWRLMHYVSYLLVILVFVHGLFLGTDLKHGLLRGVWILLGIVLLLGILSRLRRARTIS